MSNRENKPNSERKKLGALQHFVTQRFSHNANGQLEFQGVSHDPNEVDRIHVPTFDKEPFYLTADDSAGYKNNHNFALNLDHRELPNLSGLVDSCRVERKEKKVLFEQGMWVEYRSNDMEWKIGLVNRIVKQVPDSWDFEKDGEPPAEAYNIFYNVGVEGLLDEDSLRAPTQGLQFIFGKRPWLWQQFTLLQLERRIRFDESHEYDFDEIDCQEFGSDRFDLWLEAEENQDFKALYDGQAEITKELLKDNVLTPFILADKIVEDKKEWDFDDEDISVYTYLSVFGSGFLITAVTLLIQLISPLVLVYNAMYLSDGEQNPRFRFEYDEDFPDENNPDPEAINGDFLPNTDVFTFCDEANRNVRQEGKILIFIVLWVYVGTVIPDSLLSWFRTSGGANSTFSKINSLRQIIWYQNDDDYQQQFGFKLDRIMNTGYVTALYALMIFILIQTPIILDIILNALAIEFIHEIDERIANSDWWDDGNRWIRAGTIELVLQATLRLRILETPRSVCNFYDINYEDYCTALEGPMKLNDRAQAKRDDSNYLHMTIRERRYAKVVEKALEMKNTFAYDEYQKQPKQFGMIDRVLAFVGLREKGVFNRYPEFRTWSRWEKILFLPAIPVEKDELSSARIHAMNALKVKVGADDVTEFLYHIMSVLTGYEIFRTVGHAFYNGNYGQVPLKLFFGIVEWIFYLWQLIFPFIIIGFMGLGPFCY